MSKVKRNQAEALAHSEPFFPEEAAQAKAVDTSRSLDKGPGRMEERVLVSSSRSADLNQS